MEGIWFIVSNKFMFLVKLFIHEFQTGTIQLFDYFPQHFILNLKTLSVLHLFLPFILFVECLCWFYA